MRPEQSESRKEAAAGTDGVGEEEEGTRSGGRRGNLAWVDPHRDINFELWTQKFVGASGNLDAVLLDAFLPNETFARRVELYPNKLLNLQRRTLRMGSVTYVPYTVTNYVVSNCRLSLYLLLSLLLLAGVFASAIPSTLLPTWVLFLYPADIENGLNGVYSLRGNVCKQAARVVTGLHSI